MDVGLEYLTLDRTAATLAGGEAQRIRLATQIGSRLMGVLYILDEPSIGLHQRDNARLINTLMRLRDLGNTLIVVEHDEETMRVADWHRSTSGRARASTAARSWPRAPTTRSCATPNSLTGQYLSGEREIPVPQEAAQGQRQEPRRRRRPREQPEERHGRVPAGQVHLRDRRVRLGQDHARHTSILYASWRSRL